MTARRRRTAKLRYAAPVATVALVLAIALGSAAVWVAYAAPGPDASTEGPWWPGLGAVPTR